MRSGSRSSIRRSPASPKWSAARCFGTTRSPSIGWSRSTQALSRDARARPLIALRAPVDLDDEHPPLHQPCDLPESGSPALVVVVDTEEEFDWSAPFERAGTAVGHMAAIGRV